MLVRIRILHPRMLIAAAFTANLASARTAILINHGLAAARAMSLSIPRLKAGKARPGAIFMTLWGLAGERGQRDPQRPGQEDIRPRFSIVTGSVPLSHALCEQAFMAHQRAMTTILLPAMGNVVRSIVLEANDGYRDDGEEPGMQESGAARMSLEDVVIAWRDEGIDWVERRQNETRTREANVGRAREANETAKRIGKRQFNEFKHIDQPGSLDHDIADHTVSTFHRPLEIIPVDPSKSIVSRNTGPIFSESASSTSIPSSEIVSESSSPTTASKPVAPVLDPPRLLPSLAHVLVTVKHLLQFGLEAFKSVSAFSSSLYLHFAISFVLLSFTSCFRGFTFALVSCYATVMVCLFLFL
ncbi:hypothetical protein C8J56DRAFT_533595 [Mycena floridula]|nr:hypothetical protein C8J56DRAFT_533595 [Mycena floridula]